MEILIEHKNLIDFPYDPDLPQYHSLFSFDDQKINNLVAEILYTTPTCYLVSGYRGAGKTSFIRKVQQKCRELNFESGNQYEEILFIYSSFSRFENKTFFLRKIIRDLQETVIREAYDYGETENPYLTELYDKTFNEVKKERSQALETEKSAEISLESKGFFKKLLLAITPFIAPFITELLLNPLFAVIHWTFFPYLKGAVYIGSLIWGILNAIKFVGKYSIKKTNTEKLTSTSISDDNMTEYFLEQVLDKFTEQQCKLVFVLDELDKVDDDELDKLLKEMKPWLVRGKADFILVAGQKLTMKYYNLKDRDDELLASLFSKVIHIGPLAEQHLVRIFKDYLFVGLSESQPPSVERKSLEEFDEKHKELSYALCNSFIYRSKRLPRTFMNLIRQEIQWRQTDAILPVNDSNYKLEEVKMKILKKLFDKLTLNADIAETVKGHLIMQLFRAASCIKVKNNNKILYSTMLLYVINPEEIKEANYPYRELLPVLNEWLKEFYQESINEGLIVKPEGRDELNEMPGEDYVHGDSDESIDDDDLPESAAPEEKSSGNKAANTLSKDNGLNEFRNDFNTFISILQQFRTQLPTGSTQLREAGDEILLSKLITAYTNAKMFNFGIEQSTLLERPVSYYRSRLSYEKPFDDLKELFSSRNVSFNNIYRELLENYTVEHLRAAFPVVVLSRDEQSLSSVFEKQVSDYKAYVDNPANRITVLFDFKFINGSVNISSEEINRVIAILDDYNLQTQQGNYYVSIIFFNSSEGISAADIALAANYQVEKFRPDLKGKIRYFINSIFSAAQLGKELDDLKNSIQEYSAAPKLREEMSFQKKTPSDKRNTEARKGSKIIKDVDPDDPQKGKWGGKPESSGRLLSAIVTAIPDEKALFNVHLKVQSTSTDKPLAGKVTFYLHHSFSPDRYTVLAKNGIAELTDLTAYEAFTIGASCDNNRTQLELDLNTLADAPESFKY